MFLLVKFFLIAITSFLLACDVRLDKKLKPEENSQLVVLPPIKQEKVDIKIEPIEGTTEPLKTSAAETPVVPKEPEDTDDPDEVIALDQPKSEPKPPEFIDLTDEDLVSSEATKEKSKDPADHPGRHDLNKAQAAYDEICQEKARILNEITDTEEGVAERETNQLPSLEEELANAPAHEEDERQAELDLFNARLDNAKNNLEHLKLMAEAAKNLEHKRKLYLEALKPLEKVKQRELERATINQQLADKGKSFKEKTQLRFKRASLSTKDSFLLMRKSQLNKKAQKLNDAAGKAEKILKDTENKREAAQIISEALVKTAQAKLDALLGTEE